MRPPAASKRTQLEMADLRARLAEAEDTLGAIRSGAVDALVVHTPAGEQLFTLKGADQTYRALVEAMNEGAVTIRNGVIDYCNHRFAAMTRKPLETVLGASIFQFVPTVDLQPLLDRLGGKDTSRNSIETTLTTSDGRRLPVLLSASRFLSDDKPAVGMVIRDIAERKSVEQMREQLSRGVLLAQEKERQRVARDLHDGVTQLLVSAKFRLHNISARAGRPEGNADAAELLDLVEKAIAEVRLISRNLRPSELDDLGLAAAVRNLMREFENRSGITARFTHRASGSERRVREVEMTIYRIVQEALNNVEKHSGARRVAVFVKSTARDVTATIRDDGWGMSEQKKGGSGIQNMVERAAMLGGRVIIASLPGEGVSISAWVPFPNSAHNGAASHA